MKSSTVVILMVGFVAYMWITQKPAVYMPAGAQNPTGGTTATQQPDTFGQILGAVTAVFNGLGSIAQTQSKTT